jgi:hypothetical protein
MSVYRRPSAPAPHEPAPPAELVHAPVLRATDRSAALGLVELGATAGLGGVAVGALVSPAAGLAAAVLFGAGLVLWRRRAGSGVVLRVDEGLLEVRRRPSREVVARLRLVDLLDVALDTKPENVIQEGASTIPAVAFAESRVGATIDKARIVLVRSLPELSFPLTEGRGSYSEAADELGRIRVFLRKHGWVPLDERDERDD